MKFYLTIITIVLFAAKSYSQESTPLNSSRPGQAFTPLTAGKGTLQLQTGLNISETYVKGFSEYDFVSFNSNSLVRYGISDKIEVRAEMGWLRQQEGFNADRTLLDRITNVSVGSRIALIRDEDSGQYLSFQQMIDKPIIDIPFLGGSELQLLLAYMRPLIGEVTLTVNTGFAIDVEYGGSYSNYVLNLSFPINDQLGGFVENYGVIDSDEVFVSWDAGLALTLGRNVQIDLSGGFGKIPDIVLDDTRQWFVDSGVSWRILSKS